MDRVSFVERSFLESSLVVVCSWDGDNHLR